VRATFNDEDVKMLGCEDIWCPYDRFIARLSSMAISPDEYALACQAQQSVTVGASSDIDEEITSTIGGSKSKL